MKTKLTILAIAVAAIGHGQQVATTPWSAQFAWDSKTNQPLALGSYAVGQLHSSLILPSWSFGAVAFGGVETGHNGALIGAGFQLSTLFHGVTLSAFAGQGMFAGQSGFDPVFGLGVSVGLK